MGFGSKDSSSSSADVAGQAWNGRKYMGLSGPRLSRMIGVASGAGFLLFGYDQGVMGSLLTLGVFRNQFPQIDTTGNYNEHKAVMQGVRRVYTSCVVYPSHSRRPACS